MKLRTSTSPFFAAAATLALACGGPDRPAQDPASSGMATERSMETEGAKATTTLNQSSTTQTTSGTTIPSSPDASRPPEPVASSPPASPPAPAMPSSMPSMNESRGALNGSVSSANTRTNQRDRHGALTPTDQGNSAAETKITALIRNGMMSSAALSFTAKNVKVVTVGSKVTLRGPVRSDQERTAIAELARSTAGVSEVDNQLEIKK